MDMARTRKHVQFDPAFLNMLQRQMAKVSLYILLFIYFRILSNYVSVNNDPVDVFTEDCLQVIDLIDYLNQFLDISRYSGSRRPKRADDEADDIIMVYVISIFFRTS